jgi:anti-sigma regulatory factor (Ser/Thr protein kinase)
MRYAEFAECEFPADVACVASAVDKVREYCLRYGYAPQQWPQLELALVEGLNNAILHSCAQIRNVAIRASNHVDRTRSE